MKERCLHQIHRCEGHNPSRPYNIGDCYICEYDEENNKKCGKYTPIKMDVIKVEERATN